MHPLVVFEDAHVQGWNLIIVCMYTRVAVAFNVCVPI